MDTLWDTFSHSPARDEGRGLSYTPCLLTKPVLHLRLHATQSQPCFPAASNVLALPGGNLIFVAMLTERITHYTLQAKSCAKGIPFGNPRVPECVATLPPECKISGIGQPVPGADLCRLFAYMGAYCIAHINRSNLSLPYAPFCWTDFQISCFLVRISSFASLMNWPTAIAPRSPRLLERTDTVSAATSFSPTISI